MSQKKKHITIVLPDCMTNTPVRVVRGNGCSEIILDITPVDECLMPIESEVVKYALVWKNLGYVKVTLDEIEWLEADGGYTILHLTGCRDITVSFNMAQVRKTLPQNDFIQIHRSYIVNLKHVNGKIGNCLKIGDRLFAIGRKYRDIVMSRFIIIGVRRDKSRFK